MCKGEKKASKPKKRLKDSVKICPRQCRISVDQWEKWHMIEISGANCLMWAYNPLRTTVFIMPVRNNQVSRANEDQHQVHKVTTSTVKYVVNFVSHMLVIKAICANMCILHSASCHSSQSKRPTMLSPSENLASLKSHLRVHSIQKIVGGEDEVNAKINWWSHSKPRR